MMTEYSENNFEQCIKCTVCTAYCPAAAANPLFPGPKQAFAVGPACFGPGKSGLAAAAGQ